MLTGLARTALSTEAASRAPRETSPSAFAAVRFHTVTRCPAVSAASASALPMRPRPMTVTSVLVSVFVSVLVSVLVWCAMAAWSTFRPV